MSLFVCPICGAPLERVLGVGAVERIGRAKAEAEYRTAFEEIGAEWRSELGALTEGSV